MTDLIAMLPELVMLVITCLMLLTVFIKEQKVNDEDVFEKHILIVVHK